MRARGHELDGLLLLPTIRDAAERRASFRQGLTNLARAAAAWGPSPLEGVPPATLVSVARAALDAGLFDDVDWLAPAAAGVALYEIGNALPPGLEKRELGRRVLARLHEGTAETFATIAARMARGSRKGLSGASIRARTSLLFSLPVAKVDAGPLAFALVSRRELAREWIAARSTGSLTARRLAARILERAAVVAARRAREGDDYAARVFSTELVATAFDRLLKDREPLVWRHAAVARGLLAGASTTHWKAVTEALLPRHTPTEWRRGAVSLAAAIATSPRRALARAMDLLKSPLVESDRGLAGTMVWGLPRALDAEPEAAEMLLDAIVDVDPMGAANGIVAIARELGGEPGKRAVATAQAVLGDRIEAARDDAERVLASALASELKTAEGEISLRDVIAEASTLFATHGAREAHTVATRALGVARELLTALEGLGAGSSAEQGEGLRTAVLLLRDLDLGLLEDSALADLLALAGDDPHGEIDALHDRLGTWLLAHERRSPARTEGARAMSGRRLRTLLHLLDAEGGYDEDEGKVDAVHERRIESARLLFGRLGDDGRSTLHRTLCATLARALDGLVREGTCDPVDVLLVAAARLDEPSDYETLAEASMDVDVEGVLQGYARFLRTSSEEEPVLLARVSDSVPPSSPEGDGDAARTAEQVVTPLTSRIESILDLAATLGDDGSGRAEGLRAVLVRLARALRTIAGLTQRADADEATAAFEALASSGYAYAQSQAGAQLRVLGEIEDDAPASSVAHLQAAKLAAAMSHLGDRDDRGARASAHEVLVDMRMLVPPSLFRIVSEVIDQLAQLPWQGEARAATSAIRNVQEELPAWLGARRTIGGFYIVKPLGGGGAASVFVATRIEERRDPAPELFALKVPDYDGAAARSLSEQQFLDFFRAEATALLGMPADPNLARFVTFDLAARPKPILVMELIEGPTLERFIDTHDKGGSSTALRAFEILDGVLAGLQTMHKHGLGHLDVKPSNVILRHGQMPTLVDFGLAGRVVRPGCATAPYGAPEVWGVMPKDWSGEPTPAAADVYAFGALAFEVLTGSLLFDGANEVAIVSQHVVHDGHPPALDRLNQVRPLVELLEHTLRADPRKRWTVPQVRSALRAIAKHAATFPWPLGS